MTLITLVAIITLITLNNDNNRNSRKEPNKRTIGMQRSGAQLDQLRSNCVGTTDWCACVRVCACA